MIAVTTGYAAIDEAFANGAFALLLFALGGLVAFWIVFRLVRGSLRRAYQLRIAFKKEILLVTVPKESAEKGEAGQQEKTLQEIQEDIAVAENVFASIGGLTAERGLKAWFLGREDTVSFEMVASEGLVSFYVAVPKHLRDFMEQQIQAQYPLAQIEAVDDYNMFSPQGAVVGALLAFKRQHIFPIKTFKKLESDPLNAITNALAKVDKQDGAAIQIVVRSAKRAWRAPAQRIAREMGQGKSLSEAMKGGSVLGMLGEAFKAPPKKDQPPKERRMSQLEEEMVKAIEEKSAKLGLDVTVRIVASAKDSNRANLYLQNIIGAFSQYNSPQFGNSFAKRGRSPKKLIGDFIFRHFDEKARTVMTGEELASLYHLPLSSTETPNIRWLMARKPPPPQNLPKEGMVLGFVKYRGNDHVVRLKDADRRRHMYIIGKSGSGKSEFQKLMIKQDIEQGKGVCVIDPHGDLAEDCLAFVPRSRVDDVIYFNPADIERPMALNLLEYDENYPEQKTFAVNEMLKIFDKLYDLKATGGPMFEQYMRNAMILIMDDPDSGSTLMEIPKVLADEKFRAYKLTKCKTQVVKDFWQKEAQKAGGEASLANMVPYITSKLTPFISNDYMRPIIGQQNSAFNMRKVMDEGKILLMPLSKGKIGDINAYLLGMVLVGKILMAALSRTGSKDRRDFYLYIDEFQNFLTDSISIILSEARKYGLNLTIAHQFIGQLVRGNDTLIRDAVFGNVGSMVSFRVGVDDAEFLEKEFKPVFSAFDLVNVEAYTANTKILIDNTASRPFNMAMYPPVKGSADFIDAIKQLSRLKFGRDRSIVEEEILDRSNTPFAP